MMIINFQTMVSSFSRANNSALRQGFAGDMTTYLVVAGEKNISVVSRIVSTSRSHDMMINF